MEIEEQINSLSKFINYLYWSDEYDIKKRSRIKKIIDNKIDKINRKLILSQNTQNELALRSK